MRTSLFIQLFVLIISCNPPADAESSSVAVCGIDISHYQGDELDFLNNRANDLSFVLCKATEGVTATDSRFLQNWRLIRQKGLLRGAYHFYHCADEPLRQAAFYLKVTDSLKFSDFPAIVDFEEAGVAGAESTMQAIYDIGIFLKKIKAVTGRTPIVYTDAEIGNRYFTDSSFAHYPLWIADYNNGVRAPYLPGAWRNGTWIIWQKSESYSIGSELNDFDVFNGSVAELKRFLKR